MGHRSEISAEHGARDAQLDRRWWPARMERLWAPVMAARVRHYTWGCAVHYCRVQTLRRR
jgi:hypothetical protein